MRAIQSSMNSFMIWKAPKAGSLRMVYGRLRQSQCLATQRPTTHQVPHDLTRHVTPADQDTPRAHALLSTAHEALAAQVGPVHNVPNGFKASTRDEVVKDSHEVDLEELDQVIVAAVADQCTLISDRLEVNLRPGTTHVSDLLPVTQDRGEGLRDLEHVEETHCSGGEQSSKGTLSCRRLTHRQDDQIGRPARLWARRRCSRNPPDSAVESSPSSQPTNASR